MKIADIDFPMDLLSALRNRELVIFAGAGVSMGEPAELPDFKGLADGVAINTGEAIQKDEPEDRFLGRLRKKGVDVHVRAAEFLKRNSKNEVPKPNSLHRDLLRLFGQPAHVRIVTTNFDLLFQHAAHDLFDSPPVVFRAPVIPLGRHFNGVVHLHGTIDRPQEMVLTDSDFGRAYLTDGWARRFLVQLFRSYSVLFVGYSHQDTVMHYLSTALPAADSKQRLALVKEDDTEINRWNHLGIQPIPYPRSNENDYAALYIGVEALAEYATLGVLDWQRIITELAEKPPPNDEESTALIDDALRDATKTRFFTRAAADPLWIDWLDERGHFQRLFETSDLPKQDLHLARWLASTFARQHSREIVLLIARHGSRLHPHFWFELSRTLGSRDDPPLPKGVLSHWVSLLLITAQIPLDALYLVKLAKRCSEQGLMDPVVQVFDALAAPRMAIQQALASSDSEGRRFTPPNGLRLLLMADDEHWINKLWQQVVAPHLDQAAEPLLARVTSHLSARHHIHLAWQQDNRNFDSESFRRHAIEPHDQDDIPSPSDVLIDAARDCLDYLATHRPDVAVRWCDDVADSEAPLLRRLAVHTLSLREDLNSDQKCEWLLRNMDIHDFDAHHEMFQITYQIYPHLDDRQRQALIEAIRAYRSPREQDTDLRTASHQFNWFSWLRHVDPDCPLLTQPLDDIAARNPEFQPREHADLTHRMARWRRVDDQSPWTVEELLSGPAIEWLPRLLSFEPTDILGPRRSGLLSRIETAASQNFQWGLDLSDALIRGAHWQTDIWTALLQAWRNRQLDDGQRQLVLRQLESTELRDAQIQPISDFLYHSHKPSPDLVVNESLDSANELATDLWDRLYRTEPDYNQSHNWLDRAFGHPAGTLAQFWLDSLSLWRNRQEPIPTTLNESYRSALSNIVQDQTTIGTLGRCILCHNFDFLLPADQAWTEKHLLPLFDIECGLPKSTAAWTGLLQSNTIPYSEPIRTAFLKATDRLQSDLRQEGLREQFIEAYTDIIFLCVPDPIPNWIPSLFKHTDAGLRRTFAWHIRNTLCQLDNPQRVQHWERWLRRYWRNRLYGVPAPLCEQEIGTMLSWLLHLEPVYGDALEIAVQMPHAPIKNVFVLNRIIEKKLHHANPEPVAKLLDYLSHCEISHTVWKEATGLINQLLQSEIPENLKTRLDEIVAEFALD